MTRQTGKRVQIYIPADLIDRWNKLPRYERSKEVAKALRAFWSVGSTVGSEPTKEEGNLPNVRDTSDMV